MQNYSVRLVLAISLDGRIAIPLKENIHLGAKDDRRALEESLAWSDCALLGGNTLRVHRTTCLIRSPDLLNKRVLDGRSEQPIALLASNWQEKDLDFPFFQQPLKRWLIKNSNLAFDSCRDSFSQEGFDRVLPFLGTWSSTLDSLASLGLDRILLLGGASLAAAFLKEDLIDELQLTIAPIVIGGEHTWIPFEDLGLPRVLSDRGAWILQSNESLEDGDLLIRYFRKRK